MSAPRKIGLFLAIALGVVALLVFGVGRKPRPPIAMVQSPADFLPSLPAVSGTAYGVEPVKRQKSSCYQTYRRFYAKGTSDFRVAFGYKDARPSRYAGDRYERLMLEAYLVAPCSPGRYACGFTATAANPDQLEKVVTDPEGQTKVVRLKLTHSSAGPDDDLNRKDPRQREQSLISLRNFSEGIGRADLVFYNGHSRDGGGPDFHPPRIDGTGHLDYSWYLAQREGEKLLLQSLAENSPLLGIFSCRSSDHFLEAIRGRKSRLATITSPRLLFYTDALRSLLVSLEAVLGRWCEKEFSGALSPVDDPGRARLNHFFR